MNKKVSFFCSLFFIQYALYSQSVNDTVKIKEVSVQSKETSMEKILLPIRRAPALDVGEILSKQTHIFVKSYGIGSMASISMRGTGSAHTNLYWNNLNLNSSTNGITDVSLYPSFFLDGIKLSKGLESNELGSGGLGGAVHFRSYDRALLPKISIAQKIGSFGLRTTELLTRFRKNNLTSTTKVFISSADNDFEYRDLTIQGFPTRTIANANYEQKGLLQSFNYDLEESRISARFWLFTSDRNLPPFITIRENIENQKDDYIIGQIAYDKSIKKGKLSIQTSIKHSNLEYNNLRASVNSKSSSTDFSSLATLKRNFNSAFQWRSRLSYDLNSVNDRSFDGNVNRNRIGFYNALKFYGSESRNKWEHWNALISLRQEYLVDEDFFVIPTLEVEYQPKLRHEVFLFTKLGRNVKFPTLNDLYRQPFANTELKSEKSNSVELGIRHKKEIGTEYGLSTQLSFYYNDIEDYILWRPTLFGYWQPFNLDAVETAGLEISQRFETNYTRTKYLKEFQILYAYTESVNQEKLSEFDESDGKQLIYIPKHKVSLNFILGYRDYEMSIDNQYISERFTSTDNFEKIDAFQLTDVTLGREFKLKKHSLNIYASVLNVFDADYQAIQWRPMPGRNYQVKLKYTFSK